MSAPTYWSQPNQQVVRDGDPVGIINDDPDPQVKSKAKAKDEPEPKPEQHKAEPKK